MPISDVPTPDVPTPGVPAPGEAAAGEAADHRRAGRASLLLGAGLFGIAAVFAAGLVAAGSMATPAVLVAIPGVVLVVYGFRAATGRTGPSRSSSRENERARRAVEARLARPVAAAGWCTVDLATAPAPLAASLRALRLRSIPHSLRGPLEDPRAMVLAATDSTLVLCGAQYAATTAAVEVHPVAELPLEGLRIEVDHSFATFGCHWWTVRCPGRDPLRLVAPGMHGIEENAALLAVVRRDLDAELHPDRGGRA